MPLIWMGVGLLLAILAGCAEGRWVQAGKTEAHAQEDWEQCKGEVLSGQEHHKQTMAGEINLSGCMHSKGYRYVNNHPSQRTGAGTSTSY